MAPPPPMPQPALPPMREVTEDTPPDMLAGAMDLRVLLPDGHAVKMSVDRSTPMMDLLVHVTTANKMSPGSHVIQAVGEKGNILPYKPSTPIGALDTWTIQIVSKSKASVIGHKKAPLKPSNQPFEQTFRLQVNLPRNQLFVTRVSPRTPLLDVLRHVCTEKGLDPDKYELRNPMNPDEILRLTCNLLDYKLQEVTVVLRGGTTSHHSHHRLHATSPADIISLQQQHQQLTESSDKRRKSSCSTTATSSNSGGVFGFIFKRSSRSSVCEGSISSDSLGGQSISPARSDESLGPARSASPPLPQAPSRTGASHDHLRNQINNRMSRQQENSCCLNSVLSESGEGMEESQPPPPPVRQRKRRAPKPPVQHAELSSGNKKTSEFITPDPPSVPAPIPVARRKSTPVEDDEYEEEDVRTVGGGRKAKMDGGGASGTVISHSRNSSDSSGYHEASVLSESPESGLGGSGAPDTLPRRKQQHQLQQQRAAAASSSQMPAFSRSMGNLASVAPAPSSTTTTSKTLISSSYSSLSVSTSSLPGQKKKKAPAPPPPTPSGKANEAVDKSTSKTPLSTGSLDRTRHNGREDEPALLERDTVHKPKVISKVATEQTKPVQLAKQKEPPLLDVKLPVPQVDQKNNASLEKVALPPVVALSASKPSSANKLGPAVAPKPKANSTGRPGLQNGPGSLQDAIPIPRPRSKQPVPKKRIAPSPAPRSKTPALASEEIKLEKDSKEPIVEAPSSGSSPLFKKEELEDTISATQSSMENSNNLDTEEDCDELVADDLNLELFDGGNSIDLGSDKESNEEEEEEDEEFHQNVIQKILMNHQRKSFADVLNNGLEELLAEDVEMEAISNSKSSKVDGFCFEINGSDSLSRKTKPLLPKGDMEHTKDIPSNTAKVKGKIRQVESALNFSSFGEERVQKELNNFGRFSSNSLCSEVDMPFVSAAAKMNRWRNMESLNHSSSSVDAKENFRSSPLEEDDSANWVVGSESENEAGEANEGTAEEDMVDFVDDVQQIEETLIDEEIKPLVMLESEKKLDDYDLEKESEAVIASTFLPSPPPSLEYMGPEDGGDMEERVPGTEEDLEWEYKLPAPPTGFEDEEEKGPEEVKEGTWVAETASTPSTFSSSASHRKVWTGEGEPMNHLPNFRMSTYKIPSSEGWEDPREFLGNQRKTAAEAPEKPRGSTFVTLNSESTGKEEREPNKGCLETWASVSSKSSISSAPSTNMDHYNPTPYSNPGFKDAAKTEINGPIKNGSYVVRVSSFGGKSSMNLKRSLSSTSSLVSRHSNSNGREKLDKGPDTSQTVRSTFGNEMESHSLSNASRTVSLHDLAVNSIVEENRVAVSLSNGYHKENTTPKIVSSTWKKPQGNDINTTAKYPSPDSHNLRKTSSELSISQVGQSNGWKGVEDEDEQVAILQQQFLQWHEQMLQNKTTLDGSVSLKSLQVLRGVLPQLKKSLSSDLADKDAALITTAKRKDSGPRKADSRDASKDEGETFHSLSATTESNYAPSSNQESFIERTPQDAAKRYSYAGPPAINFGTWSERPKSEVSLKRDSDYRIGVGQAPRLREVAQPMANPSRSTQPPQCEVAPPCPPPKPSNRVVVNIVSATKQEPVSRLPIVRSVELKKTASSTRTVRPMSGSFPNDLREELTGALASLVDANRSGIGKDEGNERRKRQQIPCSSAVPPPPPEVSTVVSSHPTNLRRMGSAAGLECGSRLNGFGGHEKRHTIAPVVKGFRVNSMTMQSSGVPQAPPPPPPAIVCGVALKKKAEPSMIPKFSENPRDQLLTAIREFGGRESLKKTAINYK